MRVSYFINKLGDAYTSARKDFVSSWDEYDKLNNELLELQKHRNEYTSDGYGKRELAIREKIHQARDIIFEVPRLLENDTAKIRRELVSAFADRYNATPDKVDGNGLELLRSNLLTDAELDNLANKYQGNCTMERFVAQAMIDRGENKGNEQLRARGLRLMSESTAQPHLAVYDAFAELCAKGVRSGEKENTGDINAARAMSDGFDKELYTEMYNKYYSAGESISSD